MPQLMNEQNRQNTRRVNQALRPVAYGQFTDLREKHFRVSGRKPITKWPSGIPSRDSDPECGTDRGEKKEEWKDQLPPTILAKPIPITGIGSA